MSHHHSLSIRECGGESGERSPRSPGPDLSTEATQAAQPMDPHHKGSTFFKNIFNKASAGLFLFF